MAQLSTQQNQKGWRGQQFPQPQFQQQEPQRQPPQQFQPQQFQHPPNFQQGQIGNQHRGPPQRQRNYNNVPPPQAYKGPRRQSYPPLTEALPDVFRMLVESGDLQLPIPKPNTPNTNKSKYCVGRVAPAHHQRADLRHPGLQHGALDRVDRRARLDHRQPLVRR